MKFLKYFGTFIGILVVFFLSVGLFVPAFDYNASVTVNAPAEKCWEVLHDTSRMKKWLEGFESLTLKSGEWLQHGSTYEMVIQMDKRYVMSETLKEIVVPSKAAYTLTNDVMISDYSFVLEQKNSQTSISLDYHIVGNNIFWRSLLFLSKPQLKAGAEEQLVKLKLEIEAGDMDFD